MYWNSQSYNKTVLRGFERPGATNVDVVEKTTHLITSYN